MSPYLYTVFLSAYLLFQVQPIIARYILPWFGGSPSVWSTCMLFFQVVLLLGYLYAHLLARTCSPRGQVFIHVGLLTASLLWLPITPDGGFKPDGATDPVWNIIWLLTLSVGAPYLLISASGPLIQHWFSRYRPAQSPYRLYALSNLGSLVGLLTYPFVFEPNLALGSQTLFWSAAYIGFILFTIWCARTVFRFDRPFKASTGPAASGGTLPDTLLWILLPCSASVVLLAGTNQMTQDVAVVPFLWVLPLSLYLMSFIITFDNDRWYSRPVWMTLMAESLFAAIYLMHQDHADVDLALWIQILVYALAIFTCSMVCHGELARRRPPAEGLTDFYLAVAFGGALGGFFVTLIAPTLFDGLWELHIGYFMTATLAGVSLLMDRARQQSVLSFGTEALAGMVGLVILGHFLLAHTEIHAQGSIATRRNFYGVLNVYEENAGLTRHLRSIYHGRINHGSQFQQGERRRWPLTYYGEASGIGVALAHHPLRTDAGNVREALPRGDSAKGMKVGIVGLGAGVTTVFSQPDDEWRLYEINDEVVELAREYFSYLNDAEGHLEVVLGDGRITLERELRINGPERFDILAIDTFSGDAIPVHLLTAEAFELYWQHLRPDGILAIHVTNRHLELGPIVRTLADRHDKQALRVSTEDDRGRGIYYSEWILVTDNPRFLENVRLADAVIEPEMNPTSPVLWTDDYSNLLHVLK